ncbi:hypothetical protein PF001_g19171 [Phytophthora fragariae]|uniref:Uncharacterized protein n=1 Tax=Phytophthora fragariae TaxID=53985 RepID=A0A6A4CJC6_9STRA|nr:hypothetical protein PF001_g19171 [Phytophthora fragariae]
MQYIAETGGLQCNTTTFSPGGGPRPLISLKTAQQPEDRPAARRPEDRPPPTEDRSGARRPLHVAAWRGAFRMLDCVLRITRANAAEPDAKASSRTGSRHVAESCSRGVLTDQLLQRCYARCWPPKCEGSVSTSNGLGKAHECWKGRMRRRIDDITLKVSFSKLGNKTVNLTRLVERAHSFDD